MRSNSIQVSKLPMATGRSRKGMCSPESGKEEARETRVWASEGSPAGARRWGWGTGHSRILFCQVFYWRGKEHGRKGRLQAAGQGGVQGAGTTGVSSCVTFRSGINCASCPVQRGSMFPIWDISHQQAPGRMASTTVHCCYVLRQGPHVFGFQNKPK